MTLTPELVLMGIREGLVDEHLDRIVEEAHARRDLVASRKAVHLEPGDEFLIVNISPKSLTNERVRFIKHDGRWLDCEIISPFPPGKYRRGQVVKLRHSHVGIVFKAGV